jgi:hypothetical protein
VATATNRAGRYDALCAEPHWLRDVLLGVWIVFALVDLFTGQLILRSWWQVVERLASLA